MSDLTENPMLAMMGHPVSRMTPEDKALLERDQILHGRCMWYTPAEGRPYRIAPEDWLKPPAALAEKPE